MKNTIIFVLMVLLAFNGCEKKDSSTSAGKAVEWASAVIAPPREGPGTRHVVSVLYGQQNGSWELVAQSNVPPETKVHIGNANIPLPMTNYGYRYICYVSDKGGILLHVYVRNVSVIKSPDTGEITYKLEEVKDELINKFKEIKDWEVLSSSVILTEVVAKERLVSHMEWPFDQGKNVVTVTTRQVIIDNLPILLVVHYIDDDSWAFTCGTTNKSEDLMLVRMEEITSRDPSLFGIAHLPSGWSATRKTINDEWVLSKDE